ncbi:MAG TPA: hypothetical protein VGQ76_12775 [Thermoanaerobaculia bacterium]|jgi:hypothetical protein|nr:hypothetical protein [Thermoanaerobaculia bacterium]
MTSLEGNRKLHDSHHFARREHSFTSVPDAGLASHEPPAAREDAVGGGADALLLRLCADCGAPIGRPYVARLPFGLRSELPLGPNNGVLLWRRVPGTDEWIQLEYYPPDDAHDDFWLVEPLVPLKVAAIELGLRVKTLYDRAHRMASSEKHGRLWFFKRDLLLTVDAVSEARPSRAEILAEREERRTRGEIQRGGSHQPNCDRQHKGPCAGSRRLRPSERDRARTRRSILDDLGA